MTTYDRLHKQLNSDELQQKISILLSNKIDSQDMNVVMSGGEPFLNPHVFNVLEQLLKNKCNITILTNATQLIKTDIQIQIDKLLSKNPQEYKKQLRIVTAIHSSDNEIHDRLTACKNSLWESLEGLDYAVSQLIPVTIKIILSKANYTSLMDTVKYLDEHFPPEVKIQFCGMDYSGRAEKNINELFISFKELQPYVENAIDYLENQNTERQRCNNRNLRTISLLELPLCLCDPYYWRYFVVPSKDRQLYIAPNMNKRSKKDIDTAETQCGCFYKECSTCIVKRICYGTWKSSYRFSKELLRPL